MEKQMDEKLRKSRKMGKRSPGYPMISLEEAIQKAKTLWDKDKNNYIPLIVAYEHLGYRSKGGYAARIIAALKKFELISEKQDDIKLTDEAVDLALHEPSNERYVELIKNLAIKPSIYKKIFDEFNGRLPSDNTLKIKLIKDYEFNPESVEGFISNFRKTIDFAGLSAEEGSEKKEVLPPRDKDKIKENTQMQNTGSPLINELATSPALQPFLIPLSKRKKATIVFEALPVDKKDIEAIKKWLELFSDSLTESEGE